MKHAGKWAVGIVLTAAAVLGTLQTVSAPSTEPETPSAQPALTTAEETESPTAAQTCGYQWAYKNAPELTSSFDEAVKALNPDASGRVEFYGEDCIFHDGTSTFGAMETDFYVRLQVGSLNKEEDFGNWVVQVMEIVTKIPREDLSGNYGFVEFWFEKSEAEHIVFRVPIQQYINEAQGESGAELFKMFYSQP